MTQAAMRIACAHSGHRDDGSCACAPEAPPPRDLPELVRAAALRSVFGGSPGRRAVLRLLGIAGALAALDEVMPLRALEAMAAEDGPVEKKELSVGFLAITCSTPLVMADNLGLFRERGLDVELVRTPGWAVARDRLLGGEYDASHVLTPMPLAMTLGLGSPAAPIGLPVIQNSNGQGLVLAAKHRENRDPKGWKGMTFGVPFTYSMQDLLLRYYVAEHGIDPDKDIVIKAVVPAELVANLKAGILDGFLAPDNAAQLAVHGGAGFIHLLSSEIWDGHPCCGFGLADKFIAQAPNTYLALTRSLLAASAHVTDGKNRKEAAAIVSQQKYINIPKEVAEAVLTGEFDDGLGNRRSVPNRIDFRPFPYHSMGIWMLTQMRRWGYIKEEVDYRAIAERVFRAVDAQKLLAAAGLEAPASTLTKHTILGRDFDASQAAAYLSGFAIKRA
jgi:nitrate/nitrite transport system substrate-binding protein